MTKSAVRGSTGRYRYILDGHLPVLEPDLMKWAQWYEHSDKERTVGYDEIDGSIVVSTVFLGLDFAFRQPKPVLFETVARRGKGREIVEHDRYSTWDEALAGHNKIVAKLRG